MGGDADVLIVFLMLLFLKTIRGSAHHNSWIKEDIL